MRSVASFGHAEVEKDAPTEAGSSFGSATMDTVALKGGSVQARSEWSSVVVEAVVMAPVVPEAFQMAQCYSTADVAAVLAIGLGVE